MAYTKELIDEVKELYPDYQTLIDHAVNGSVMLGRFLDDCSPEGIPINEVLNATSLEELKKMAILYKRRKELYIKWCKEDPRRP